ncbi:MAG: methyltransferase domain-containing protein [Saprospiraceae bacterium]|nr:methyltransferase domain-containing protein [Saprospiraceae bacterium]
MDKLKSLFKIQQIYKEGGNIIQFLKSMDNTPTNRIEDIMISYDFQAGSYIQHAMEHSAYTQSYTKHIAQVINNLGGAQSILEAGVGEATTLANVLRQLHQFPNYMYGFDLSWSRVKYGIDYVAQLGLSGVQLMTSDLFSCPFPDNSIDIVYTSHSIEPNGGKEEEALVELFRITNKYLILLEPAYEFADEAGRNRMKKHGYATHLYETVLKLGYEIVEYRPFEVVSNPLNPTGLMIIKKSVPEQKNEPTLHCPITKTPLTLINGSYYSQDALLAYPIIAGVPCLLPQNAIIATHFLAKMNGNK